MRLLSFLLTLGLVWLLSASALQATDQLNLPDLRSSADRLMTPAEARERGEQFRRMIQSYGAILDDPLVEEYVEHLGYRLVSHSNQPDAHFSFFVVNHNSVNAFATFGGYVGIHTGLILAAEEESELAAVMAHEIAHVTQGHLNRVIESTERVALPIMLAAMAAALVADSGQGAIGALATGQAAIMQAQINFTRAHEYEADRIGIQMLHRAGFDPLAMAHFFEEMARLDRRYVADRRENEVMRTHPVTSNRIAEAKSRANALVRQSPPDPSPYFIVRNRVLALTTSSPHETLRRLLADTEREIDPRKREAMLYGQALLNNRVGNHDRALEILEKLVDKQPRRAFLLAQVQTLSRLGRNEQALSLAQDVREQHPGNYAAEWTYAQTLMSAGQFEQAWRVLDRLRWEHSEDRQLFEALSQAADRSGRPMAAREALAQHHELSGRLRLALDQYRDILAREDIDYYTRVRVESRRDRLQREYNELSAAQRRQQEPWARSNSDSPEPFSARDRLPDSWHIHGPGCRH